MVRMCFQQALLSLVMKSKCSRRSIKTCRARPSFRKIRIAKKPWPGPHGSSPSSAGGADTLPINRQDPLQSTMSWHVAKLLLADGPSNMCRCPSARGEGEEPDAPYAVAVLASGGAAPDLPDLLRPVALRRGLIGWARRHPAIAVGGALVLAMLLIALFAPFLGTVDPTALAPVRRTREPSAAFWFGTDMLGRDIYSRVLYGARVSLTVGFSVGILASLAGLSIGLVSGFIRRLDGLIMRVMDGLMSIPPILLAVALMALTRGSVGNVITAITIAEIPRVSRLVRSVVLSLREQPFVDAAVAAGTRTPMIILRHILPNTLAPMTVQATYVCASAMIIEAILSFIGAGTPPTIPSCGNIMAEGRALWQVKPFIVFFPAALRSIRARRKGREMALLEVENMQTHFRTPDGINRAVDGVSFQVEEGETLAIVGESGCGKSVTSMSLMRLIPEPPGKIAGSVRFQGRDLLQLSEREMRAIRGNDISMIFQEPMTSLNPVLSVGRQIGETLRMHQGLDRQAAEARAIEMLTLVGIPDPAQRVREYPHQLSGGMRQRVMIAMALACNPKLLIADEPTTALDVTIQAQILHLMLDLKRRVGAAIVLITHDLGVVAEVAERVMVMYAGRKVEEAPVAELFRSHRHPYTQGLLGAVPKLGSSLSGAARRLAEIPGQVPSLKMRIEGCVFAGRCFLATDLCREVAPGLEEKGPRHIAACHYARKEAAAA